eukprot:UN12046
MMLKTRWTEFCPKKKKDFDRVHFNKSRTKKRVSFISDTNQSKLFTHPAFVFS